MEEGADHPGRDAQFQDINDQVRSSGIRRTRGPDASCTSSRPSAHPLERGHLHDPRPGGIQRRRHSVRPGHGGDPVLGDVAAPVHLVPFSCKGRGFCPSCGGRRMTELAAHLVDAVLPRVPVRQ